MQSNAADFPAQWERLDVLGAPLLAWYDANRRVLPWREIVSPYRTWVSEIMLQQTRVGAVLPYFERFMEALPNVAALAAVPEAQLLKLWEGLGYYSRARNLQRAARLAVERYGGVLPRTAAELTALPGIGAYTAAAIASINFGEPVAAVDGNLLRVTARLCGSFADVTDTRVRRTFTEKLNAAIDRERPGAFNQAMMDLGAMVCLPNGAPLCGRCPLRALCAAYRDGTAERLPVRTPKPPRRAEEKTVFLLTRGGKVAVRQRPDTGLLAGLIEFPNVPGSLDEAAAALALAQAGLHTQRVVLLGTAKHVFTHVEWQMRLCRADVTGDDPSLRWVDHAELNALAIPSAFRKMRKLAEQIG